MSVGALYLFAAAAASVAPFQCAGEAKPDLRREEEPAEALYGLAEKFKAKGDAAAQAETLRYIVKMYPTSRFAESARIDLEGLSEGGGKSDDKSDGAKGGASGVEKAAPAP